MTVRLVVTGVAGFVGHHVARMAAEEGWSVFGVSSAPTPPAELEPYLDSYVGADLREEWPREAPTDAAVIHLAGLAAVGPSFDAPQEYIEANSAMVTRMCEALLAAGGSGRIVGVSTGAVYASTPTPSVHAETSPVGFSSPYVVSKLLVESQLHYYQQRGLDSVVARPFNHIGPGQGPGFLVPDLARRLRELSPGEPLTVGNLDTRRDYTDVRDVARAYLLLAAAPQLSHPLFNVASGTALSGRAILDLVCAALEIDVPPLRVDRARVRPNDPASIAGDASRLHGELGWLPTIPVDQTIAEFVASTRS